MQYLCRGTFKDIVLICLSHNNFMVLLWNKLNVSNLATWAGDELRNKRNHLHSIMYRIFG